MIPYKEIYNQVIKQLKNELPSYYSYHDYKHTLYVLKKAIFLADKMDINDYDTLLLKIACLYHDTGFLISRESHEYHSCQIMKKDLQPLLPESDIQKIEGMIMATQIPARPETQLESIIADADLEYLGTNEFETIGNKLKSEIFHFQSNMTDKQWDEIQVKFLKNHRYFTPWCKKYREPQKQRNLSSVIERLNQ